MSAAPACGPLSPAELLDLDAYARERAAFRARVIAHKRDRTVAVGPHMSWIFEDRLTILYQVQEMLRIERLTDPGVSKPTRCNPLVLDGSNWKVTLLIEYRGDPAACGARRAARVEDRCWSGGRRPLRPSPTRISSARATRASAVHWMRFELSPATRAAVRRRRGQRHRSSTITTRGSCRRQQSARWPATCAETNAPAWPGAAESAPAAPRAASAWIMASLHRL